MNETWFRLCGRCKHFEANLFDEPVCHKGHKFEDPDIVAKCPDREEWSRAYGPDFDMGED